MGIPAILTGEVRDVEIAERAGKRGLETKVWVQPRSSPAIINGVWDIKLGDTINLRALGGDPVYCSVQSPQAPLRVLFDHRETIQWAVFLRNRQNRLKRVWVGTLPHGKSALERIASAEVRQAMGTKPIHSGVMMFLRNGKWCSYDGDPCRVFVF